MAFQNTLNEFAQRLGMDTISLDSQGIAAFDITDLGRLSIEKKEHNGTEEILLYLSREIPPHNADIAEKSLAFCHYGHAHPYPLWSGVYKDTLIVLTRMDAQTSSGQMLENAVLFLTKSLDAILS